MSMSGDEYAANLAVQNLKPDVDEAEKHIDAGTLNTLSGKRLQELIDSVDKSIRKRNSLKSMGLDERHLYRVGVEQNFLDSLRKEAAARKDAAWKLENERQAASLKDVKLPANSTWGKK
jgi:hypothetical protein